MKNWVKKLVLKNWQGIEFMEIMPDDESYIVQIEGDNEAGKSRALRGLYYLVCGGKLPKEPVTKGQKKAELYAEIGDYTLRAIIKADKDKSPTFEVRTKDGAKVDISPREWTAKRLSENTVDPYRLASMNDKEFYEYIKKVTNLDFTEEEKEIDLNYTRRTEVGRQLDIKKKALTEYDNLPELDGKFRDETDILKEQEEIFKHNRAIDDFNEQIGELETEIKDTPKAIEDYAKRMDEHIKGSNQELDKIKSSTIKTIKETAEEMESTNERRKQQIETLKQEITDLVKKTRDKIKSLDEDSQKEINLIVEDIKHTEKEKDAATKDKNAELDKIKQDFEDKKKQSESMEKKSTESLTEELVKIKEYSKLKSKYDRREVLMTEKNELQGRHDELDSNVEAARQKKLDKIKAAKTPAKGLEVTDDGILIDGIPFEQQSKSRKIKLTMEISIELKQDIATMIIEDVKVIGEKMKNELIEMENKKGIQLLFEKI